MKLVFSFAAVAQRVFDSAPPDSAVRFDDGERILHPLEKTGGIYVFVDEQPRLLTMRCAGYLPVTFCPRLGEVLHLALFPSMEMLPPAGWKLAVSSAPPGLFRTCSDSGCVIRVTDFGTNWVCLRARPGFTGGCLLWSRGKECMLSFIQEKQPPDRYLLDRIPPDPQDGWELRRVYAGRADENGVCSLVAPINLGVDLESPPMSKEGVLWETTWYAVQC